MNLIIPGIVLALVALALAIAGRRFVRMAVGVLILAVLFVTPITVAGALELL